MSTGADCRFTEVTPGKWQYELQRWPYGDWPEYDHNGLFASFREAQDHLDAHYANPGGWSVFTHEKHVHEPYKEHGDQYPTCRSCGHMFVNYIHPIRP